MKKYLLAYQISGQTVGIDIKSWNTDDLNNKAPFMIINSGDTIPVGYANISSIVNWDSFGEGYANDYLVVRFEIKALLLEKGWANLTNTEKDLCIKHYVGDTTDAVIYLMGNGYPQEMAQGFVLQAWHKYHAKLLEACQQRLYYLKFIAPQFLSLEDSEKLFDNAQMLIYEFTQLGRFGLANGDKKSGIVDYLMSTNAYVGVGMEESGITLLQGTWDYFRNELIKITMYGIYTKYQ
jgi:hypothetical protein